MQASAALAGLIFVALDQSFADRFIPGLPGRAAESLIMLIGVLVICSVGLVPDISAQAVGLSFAFGGGLDWLAPGAVFCFIASAVNARVLLVEIVR